MPVPSVFQFGAPSDNETDASSSSGESTMELITPQSLANVVMQKLSIKYRNNASGKFLFVEVDGIWERTELAVPYLFRSVNKDYEDDDGRIAKKLNQPSFAKRLIEQLFNDAKESRLSRPSEHLIVFQDGKAVDLRNPEAPLRKLVAEDCYSSLDRKIDYSSALLTPLNDDTTPNVDRLNTYLDRIFPNASVKQYKSPVLFVCSSGDSLPSWQRK